jgi:hypothetical protein
MEFALPDEMKNGRIDLQHLTVDSVSFLFCSGNYFKASKDIYVSGLTDV